MTVLIEDPLIAGMAIKQTLPLHESSRRLRELYPECPRVSGVAVMGDLSRRRWRPLAEALTGDRLQAVFDVASAETENRAAVAHQLAATLAHVVLGRVIALLVLGWLVVRRNVLAYTGGRIAPLWSDDGPTYPDRADQSPELSTAGSDDPTHPTT